MHWLMGVLHSTQSGWFLSKCTQSNRLPQVKYPQKDHFKKHRELLLSRATFHPATCNNWNAAGVRQRIQQITPRNTVQREGGWGVELFIDRIRPGGMIISLQVNDNHCVNFCNRSSVCCCNSLLLTQHQPPLYAHLTAAHQCVFYLENFIILPSYQRASLWSCV